MCTCDSPGRPSREEGHPSLQGAAPSPPQTLRPGAKGDFFLSAPSDRCTVKKPDPPCIPALGPGDDSTPFVFLKREHQGGKKRKHQRAASLERPPGEAGPRRQGCCLEAGWGPGGRHPPRGGREPHKRPFVTPPGSGASRELQCTHAHWIKSRQTGSQSKH